MLCDFGPKQLKLKRGDIGVRTKGSLTALVWKDRREVCMLTNIDPPPAWGNFCDDSNRPMKPHIVDRYNRHMGYFDSSDRMADSYSMSWRTFKWTTKLFFHLLDLSTVGYCYHHVGLNTPTEISDSFWWGIWLRKLERANIAPPPDWLEDPVQLQQMFCDSRVVIINAGKRSLPHISGAVSVLLVAKESEQSISVPDVTWACAWCLVSRNFAQK